MGQSNSGSVLQALAGKKVLFQGKFEWGHREHLRALAEVQQGMIATDLDASVHYLVLPDLAGNRAVQKKAQSLNAKGAAVQVVDASAFEDLARLTESQVLALLRGGRKYGEILGKALGEGCGVAIPVNIAETSRLRIVQGGESIAVAGEKFDGEDLTGFWLMTFVFEQCSFIGATLTDVMYVTAKGCDFGKAKGGGVTSFKDATGSRFVGAVFAKAEFANIDETDFTGANLERARFSTEGVFSGAHKAKVATGCVFARAMLRGAKFQNLVFKAPDFGGADLQDAVFVECSMQEANLRGAKMQNAMLGRCNLAKADLTGADLRGANLGEADLSDARLDGADLDGCNLRGAKLGGVDLKKAKNYRPEASVSGTVGPALQELDGLAKKARRIALTFRVAGGPPDGEEVGIDTNGLKYGWGISVPESLGMGFARYLSAKTMADAVIQLANLLGHRKVRFETVDVQSTKSPKGGKELRDLVISGLAEAFAQTVPAAEELAAATKAWREQVREAGAAERQQREEARKAAEAKKVAEKKKIAKTIEKQVGKVTDTATFLKALELRIEKPKIEKATKMLKASGFQLFNDVTDSHLLGVVKSQTDPDLVYACRVDAEGNYACCTQNLNICGGLRGSICKHLLVLIIGLVQAGELDPTTIDGWVAKTHDAKPELDKETMGEIFIRYKGAEAGEVDWRPTQTVPEDYYTL